MHLAGTLVLLMLCTGSLTHLIRGHMVPLSTKYISLLLSYCFEGDCVALGDQLIPAFPLLRMSLCDKGTEGDTVCLNTYTMCM